MVLSKPSFTCFIIGGDKNIRKTLIDKLNDPRPMNNDPKETDSLASYITKRLQRYDEFYSDSEKRRMKFENWEIRECDENDPNAIELAKRSELIISIITNRESIITLDDFITNPQLPDHLSTVCIVDENFPDTYWSNTHYKSLSDLLISNPDATNNWLNFAIPTRYCGYNYLYSTCSFYWNRNNNTFK